MGKQGTFNLIFFMFYFKEGPVIADGRQKGFGMQKRLWARTVLLVLGMFLTSCAVLRPQERVVASLQAVVVKTSGWDRIDGILEGYERGHPETPWVRVIDAVPVVVGRSGMGWGVGLHPVPESEAPLKQEGDGRAPAGIFTLPHAFGYAADTDASWIRLPYRQASSRLICIDDIRSVHYNHILDAEGIAGDWQGHEKMRRPDGLYRLGIVVGHNTDPPVAGRGSCIFIHIWQGSHKGTAGCTAMAEHDLENLLLWLDPTANPLFIQLPVSEYGRLRVLWCLP